MEEKKKGFFSRLVEGLNKTRENIVSGMDSIFSGFSGGNDSRKVISDLRKEGWNIKDVRLDDKRKLYWLEPDKRQMSIDWKGGSNE